MRVSNSSLFTHQYKPDGLLGLSAQAVEVSKRMGWSPEELDHAVVRMISAALQVLTDLEHVKPRQPWTEPS